MKKGSRSLNSKGSLEMKKAEESSVPETGPPSNASNKSSRRRKLPGSPSPVRENTTGLAILPDELLLEILSYYPESEPDPNEEYSKEDADAHFARRERLITLSQTCRNLRRFLRPYVWRRIEVFTGMRVSAGEVLDNQEKLALELLRQLEIVTIRDSELAEYVNVVNVVVEDHHVRNVLRELTRCLAIFPNMHTLKLDLKIPAHPFDQVITYGFGRHKSFPQIRSITLRSYCCASLLRFVPNVRNIYFIAPKESQPESHLLAYASCCPRLENIRILVPFNFTQLAARFVEQFPNIRDLTLQFTYGNFTQIDLSCISNYRDLKIVRMDVLHPMDSQIWEGYRSQVKDALLDIQNGDKEEKTIVIRIESQPKEVITLPWPPIFKL